MKTSNAIDPLPPPLPARPLRILHVFPEPFLHNRATGMSNALWELTAAQHELGHDATIHAAPGDAARLEEMRRRYPAAHLLVSPIVGPHAASFSPAAERWARSEEAGAFDVLHQHGIWPAFSRMTNAWREQHGRPTVVAPHGALAPNALRASRWKKRLALAAWAREALSRASCLQVSSERELTRFRDLGFRNPVAVIPNGVNERWLRSSGDGARFRAAHGIPPDGRIVLFLSRIHPSKGLLEIVEAMAREADAMRDWRLVIAGPVAQRDYHAAVQRRAAQLGIADRIHFTGALFDQPKRDAFAAAELFVLATTTDNFAIVIAEAAGAGVPVITTREALPWHVLETERAGWWVAPDVAALGGALRDAARLPPSGLQSMGARAKALVERSFRWSDAAQRSIRLYRWLLGDAARPEFVIVN